MPDLSVLEELWRRSLDLNVRYYGAVGRLTADYFKDLVSVVSELRAPQPAGGRVPATSSGHTAGARADSAATNPAPSISTAGTMVLEGETGGRVLGVFLVENHLNRGISAKVAASPFIDASGRTVQPVLAFDPDLIVLGPGEQLLVRVVAVIDDTLEPEVRYVGQFIIPGLTGTRIPVVLRRRPGLAQVAAQPAEDAPTPATKQTTKTTRRRRTTKGKVSSADEGREN